MIRYSETDPACDEPPIKKLKVQTTNDNQVSLPEVASVQNIVDSNSSSEGQSILKSSLNLEGALSGENVLVNREIASEDQNAQQENVIPEEGSSKEQASLKKEAAQDQMIRKEPSKTSLFIEKMKTKFNEELSCSICNEVFIKVGIHIHFSIKYVSDSSLHLYSPFQCHAVMFSVSTALTSGRSIAVVGNMIAQTAEKKLGGKRLCLISTWRT